MGVPCFYLDISKTLEGCCVSFLSPCWVGQHYYIEGVHLLGCLLTAVVIMTAL